MGLFDFGKKRRMSKRSKVHHKPPARLLSICKKYRIKATTKSGGKHVYKKVSVLKKLCLRKAIAHRKKLVALKKKQMMKRSRRGSKKMPKRRRRGSKKVSRRRRSVMRMGEEMLPAFGRSRRSGFGLNLTPVSTGGVVKHCYVNGSMRMDIPKNQCTGPGRSWFFGSSCSNRRSDNDFGKRPRVARAKGSKMAAMKAFRSFYKRHCAGARRRSRFGSGNPPLYQSMGYEFCPSGRGGVLGSNSTGLFPSPCTPLDNTAREKEMGIKLPAYSSSGPVKFGYRRRRTSVGETKRRRSSAAGGLKRRRRRSTM
jgi:hypothetical protein